MMNLKYCMALVWVLALLIMLKICLASPFERWSVQVSNDMKSGEKLFLHCKSKDDDLGKHYMTTGQQFSWKFRENLWQNTLFWCYMGKINHHVSLEVFWPEAIRDPWLRHRCQGQVCYWSARDDGIYIKNVPENKFEHHANWI